MIGFDGEYYEPEPPSLCDGCGHKHSADNDCEDDGLCVLASCTKKATHGPGPIPAFCAEHDMPAAENE